MLTYIDREKEWTGGGAVNGDQWNKRLRLPLLILWSGLLLFSAHTPAQAGIFGTFKGIMELPEEIDRLKEDYEQVRQNYNDTMSRLEEAERAAQSAAQTYESSQQKLIQENEKLQSQNRELLQMVLELQQSEQERRQKASRFRTIVWTAVGLVGGYFVLTRGMRVVLRSR